ncbi:MAG: helix-turn-helix domain-containing protein [Chitinophagales bacterium]
MEFNPQNPIAVFVKKNRKAEKLTQRGLAEKAGVGLRFVREMERGKTTLRLDKVNIVLALFGKQVGPISKEDDVSIEG